MHVVVQSFLNPILPTFAIMLIGIILARKAVFDIAAALAINKFVFFVAVPALLFSLISRAPLDQLNIPVLLSYFTAEVVVYLGGAASARMIFKREIGESILIGMACCFVNHVFFILPIATSLYGEQAAVPITAIIVIDTTLIFGGTIIGLEIASHRGEAPGRVALTFIRNPVLLAIGLGLATNISNIEVHAGIDTFTAFAGSAAPPAALFSLGIILAGSRFTDLDGAALAATLLSLVIMPLLIWLLLGRLADIEPLWRRLAILVGAGPCGAMPFVLALRYEIRAQSIGMAIIYSTIASLFTLSVLA
jgi:predicted permease